MTYSYYGVTEKPNQLIDGNEIKFSDGLFGDIKSFIGHKDGVVSTIFYPEANILISCTRFDISAWDFETGECKNDNCLKDGLFDNINDMKIMNNEDILIVLESEGFVFCTFDFKIKSLVKKKSMKFSNGEKLNLYGKVLEISSDSFLSMHRDGTELGPELHLSCIEVGSLFDSLSSRPVIDEFSLGIDQSTTIHKCLSLRNTVLVNGRPTPSLRKKYFSEEDVCGGEGHMGGGSREFIFMIDYESKKFIKKFKPTKQFIYAIDSYFNGIDEILISCGGDGVVSIFSLTSGKLLKDLHILNRLRTLKYLGDQYLLLGDYKSDIIFYDLKNERRCIGFKNNERTGRDLEHGIRKGDVRVFEQKIGMGRRAVWKISVIKKSVNSLTFVYCANSGLIRSFTFSSDSVKFSNIQDSLESQDLIERVHSLRNEIDKYFSENEKRDFFVKIVISDCCSFHCLKILTY